jgi:hypothetical protein
MKKLIGFTVAVLFALGSSSAIACDKGGGDDDDSMQPQITSVAPSGPTIGCDGGGDGGDDS